MGKYLKILFILVFLILFSCNCFAANENLDQFLSGAPDDFTYSENISETVGFNKLFSMFSDIFTNQFKNCVGLFTSLSVTVLLFSLLDSFVFDEKKSLKSVSSCVIAVALIGISFGTINSNIEIIKNSVDSMKIFSTTAVPVIAGLCISGGNSFSGAVFSSSVSLCTTAFEYVSQYILLPVTAVFMGTGAASSLTDDYNMLSIGGFIKKFIKWAIGVFVGVFTISISLQSFLSAASDSLTKKSIQMAVGSFIPMIGSTLSGSVDNLFALAASTKTSFAILGIVIIIAIFLPPVVGNICYGLTVLAVKCAAGFLKSKRLEKMLSVISDCFFMLAGICSACVYMTIASFLIVCINIG